MQTVKIICPVCGREYLPEEIFVPSKPSSIVRDNNGKIISYVGDSFSLEEQYCCDCCNTTFRVIGYTRFSTDVAPIVESKDIFNEEYTTKFQKMSLAEE